MATDEIGKQYGAWTIIREAGVDQYSNRKFLVRCECGLTAVRHLNGIRAGKSRRCRRCTFVARGGINSGTHHGSHLPEYKVWLGIRERCSVETHKSFKHYGERGVKVCSRWLGQDGFANFLKDMGRRPFAKSQIERMNNDGDYSPTNCRWATAKQQARNRRNNRLLTIDGKTKTLAEWAELSTVKYHTIKRRLQMGWAVEKAVFEPVR